MHVIISLHGIPDAPPVVAQVQELLHGALCEVADRITTLEITIERSLAMPVPERVHCLIAAHLHDGHCARAEGKSSRWSHALDQAGHELQAVLLWHRDRINRITVGNAVITVAEHPPCVPTLARAS